MPATIIQTNKRPFSDVDVDPITLDIIENALRNARNEMDATLFRTALSPGIREQGDARKNGGRAVRLVFLGLR